MDKLLSGRRVLFVEDETLVVIMIEDMLTDLGCESVTAAATVDKGLALIDAQVSDAAMPDMNLNGNTSHSVAAALVARGVPFVYCTGNNGHKLGDVYHNRPVLKKPFKYEELVEGPYTPALSLIERYRLWSGLRCCKLAVRRRPWVHEVDVAVGRPIVCHAALN